MLPDKCLKRYVPLEDVGDVNIICDALESLKDPVGPEVVSDGLGCVVDSLVSLEGVGGMVISIALESLKDPVGPEVVSGGLGYVADNLVPPKVVGAMVISEVGGSTEAIAVKGNVGHVFPLKMIELLLLGLRI
ncbi:hypothetical protein V6N13_113480 [Hibiscus sabdariffa]